MSKTKVVVLKVEGKYMRVATEDRQFLKIPITKEPSPGKEIWIDNSQNGRIFSYRTVAAAMFLFVLLGGIYTTIFTGEQPVAYVSIDINPSFEFALDENKEVLEVTPLNDEAKRLDENMELEGKKLQHSLQSLLMLSREAGYITLENENAIFVTVVNTQEESVTKNYKDMRDEITKAIKDENIPGRVGIQTATLEERSHAKEKQKSLNEHLLKKKVSEETGSIKDFEKTKGKGWLQKLDDSEVTLDKIFDDSEKIKGPPSSTPGFDEHPQHDEHPRKDDHPPGNQGEDKGREVPGPPSDKNYNKGHDDLPNSPDKPDTPPGQKNREKNNNPSEQAPGKGLPDNPGNN
ncbi:anti-sigma factor domain-containing protein [Natranaerobius trueperi]|uniref:RsgI N-terminal anti-sigma domain-containing protein n=1 Tax=Natranaerobius trueperi TaxID=759412 RepID=A0A226BZF8_9FIRM|nr:anti-sigma factor domain-containing protein [Natranaerobius trueperi]OWZ84376.1 hypothetical protein CDO51_03695 [Natranaerobius trueperi]